MIDFELFGFKLPEFEDYGSHRNAMAFTHPMPTTNVNYGVTAANTLKKGVSVRRKPKVDRA